MLIVYATRTGNVRRFVNKVTSNSVKIKKGLIIEEPYILITYTTGFGLVPQEVLDFLVGNHKYMVGVAASGNLNWGNSFCKSADIISNTCGVPIISKFEMSGSKADVEYFIERVNEIERESNIVKQ